MPKKLKTPALGPVDRTARGFEIIRFKDRLSFAAKLQISSLADFEQTGVSAVIIGSADPVPQIMNSKASAHGLDGGDGTGWRPYPLHEDVFVQTDATLNRDQVAALIAHLTAWLETGSFELSPKLTPKKKQNNV